MKNSFSTKDGVSKKKRFYISIFVCLSVLLVFGIAMTAYNVHSTNVAESNRLAAIEEYEAAEAVLRNQARSYSQARGYVDPFEDEYLDRNLQIDSVAQNRPSDEAPQLTEDDEEEKENEQPAEESMYYYQTNEETTGEEARDEPGEEPAPENTNEEPAAESFSSNVSMSWPLIGEIVMDYSVDHVIYDKTLDVFRTNDSLSISAPVGTQVKAAAAGTVRAIFNDPERGNTVVIDNGNGWETTYSQLQEVVLVSEGDVVSMGQIIGGVAEPTRHSILKGSHLQLRVAQNNETVDPKIVLVQ